jgi:ABC-type transporter MlaC component
MNPLLQVCSSFQLNFAMGNLWREHEPQQNKRSPEIEQVVTDPYKHELENFSNHEISLGSERRKRISLWTDPELTSKYNFRPML